MGARCNRGRKVSTVIASLLLMSILSLALALPDGLSGLGRSGLSAITGGRSEVRRPSTLNSVTTAMKGVTLSDDEVLGVARDSIRVLDAENRIAPESDPYAQRLAKLMAPHLAEDGLKLEVKVYLGKEINAFALPNGSIRVYSALMDLLKDEELLSVIGHEIGHVKLGHAKSQMRKAYITSAAVDLGAAQAGASHGSAASGLAGAGVNLSRQVVKEIAKAQFSQGDEMASDDYGLRFLKTHHYNPEAAVQALEKLAKIEQSSRPGGDALGFLFSTHPNPHDRAARLAAQLK